MTRKFRSALVNKQLQQFEVGNYYSDEYGYMYKIINKREDNMIEVAMLNFGTGEISKMVIPSNDPLDKPATAEQIALFQRAENFASKGRKLDEWHIGDKAEVAGEITTVDGFEDGLVVVDIEGGCYFDPDCGG